MTSLRRSCPACRTSIDTATIASQKNERACHTDFFQRFAGFQPVLRGALSCPVCGYADFTGNFPYDIVDRNALLDADSEGIDIEELPADDDVGSRGEKYSPISESLRRFVRRNLLPIPESFGEKERFTPHEYERIALISEYRGDNPEQIGLIYLFAAWSCRCLDKETLEPWYDGRYALWFEQAALDSEAQGIRAAFHAYLSAEGFRRSGDTASAMRLYELAMRFLDSEPDYGWFFETISRQADYPAEYLEDTLKYQMNTLFHEMTGMNG